LFPFTFFFSEDVSIIAVVVFAIVAWLSSRHHAALVHRFLLAAVGTSLLGWCLLLVSGVLGPSTGPLQAIHSLVGHLLLPVVASATGLWLGTSFPKAVQHPLRFLLRSALLLLLCFCCFSNTRTGYFGPSRVDPGINPANKIRFDVLHQVAIPVFIGLVLVLWFRRLVRARVGRSLEKR